MLSKQVFHGGRRVVTHRQRLCALIHSESENLPKRREERRDPFDDLANSINTTRVSLERISKRSKGTDSYGNVSKEVSNPHVKMTLSEHNEEQNYMTADAEILKKSTEVDIGSVLSVNTQIFERFFPRTSLSEVVKAVNSDLQSCTPETLAEIDTYLDEVEKLDPDSEEWDHMTTLIPHPDENRGIRYDFLPRISESFESYIGHSETLQQLVMLGVDLSSVQKFPYIGNLLIRQDFEKDIVPKLLYLKDLGVYDHNIGDVLTTNPYILEDPITKLQSVVDYLKSKRFTADMVGKMVVRHSMFLIMEVAQIDSKLGMFQKLFRLKGDEMRSIFSINPVLISHSRKKIQDVHFLLHSIWGFDQSQLQAIFLKCPLIFTEDARSTVQSRLEVLYDMGISPQKLSETPEVLLGDQHKVRRRHAFLKEIGRAHYDPEKAGYVSLQSLAMYTVDKWCWKINVPKEHYMTFLKTE